MAQVRAVHAGASCLMAQVREPLASLPSARVAMVCERDGRFRDFASVTGLRLYADSSWTGSCLQLMDWSLFSIVSISPPYEVRIGVFCFVRMRTITTSTTTTTTMVILQQRVRNETAAAVHVKTWQPCFCVVSRASLCVAVLPPGACAR